MGKLSEKSIYRRQLNALVTEAIAQQVGACKSVCVNSLPKTFQASDLETQS